MFGLKNNKYTQMKLIIKFKVDQTLEQTDGKGLIQQLQYNFG